MTHALRTLAPLSVALATSFAVSNAMADDGYPQPMQTQPMQATTSSSYQATEVRPTPPPNGPLLGGGLAFFAGAYATAVVVGASNDNDADRKLYIPVVGPWLDLADRKCDQHACADESLSKAGLIIDGAVQGVGVIAIISSFFVPSGTRVSTVQTQAKAPPPPPPPVYVLPSSMGGHGAGLRLGGSF